MPGHRRGFEKGERPPTGLRPFYICSICILYAFFIQVWLDSSKHGWSSNTARYRQMVIRHVSRQLYQLRAFRVTGQCLAGCVGIAILTYIGFALQVNLTTISLLYLLIVIPAALYFGFWQASLTSVLAAACLDYFFTQPIFHFYITDPKEWVALGVFQIAAVVISRLSRKELQSSVEAGLNPGGM